MTEIVLIEGGTQRCSNLYFSRKYRSEIEKSQVERWTCQIGVLRNKKKKTDIDFIRKLLTAGQLKLQFVINFKYLIPKKWIDKCQKLFNEIQIQKLQNGQIKSDNLTNFRVLYLFSLLNWRSGSRLEKNGIIKVANNI